VILGALSLLAYAGVAAYVLTRDERLAGVVAVVVALGGGFLLLALVKRLDDLLVWPVLLAGVAYAIPILVDGSGVDEGASLVAAALLLASELAAWSFDEHRRIRAERAVVLARAGALGLLVTAGLAASSLVLGLSAAPIGGGLGWTVLGAFAAVAVVGLAARVGRR
jgi:hypothetical protein